MKLDVPLIISGEKKLQEQAAVEMVLRFYDEKYTEATIDACCEGTYANMADIAYFFMHHGYRTQFISLQPLLFNVHNPDQSQEALREHMKNSVEFATGDPARQHMCKRMLAYMLEGGTVVPEIPTCDIVKRELDEGYPVIARFATEFDVDGRSMMNHHPCVITGYTDSHIFVNDPSHTSGGHKKILIKWFFGGVYGSRHEALDDGSLVTIAPL